ncbi:MAG: tyrosine-type recombinase/integrase [Oscillospiraceae bacterium]|nr:tyrosine-type recombinase/integrase [Oscillospiraceae bacterium]
MKQNGKSEKAQRRAPTKYPCIYKQTGKPLYDVRYNYKEEDKETGKVHYKNKWVYGLGSLDLARSTLLQLQMGTYDDGEITLQEAFELWQVNARILQYKEVTIRNTTGHMHMIYTVLPSTLKLKDVDYALYSRFIEQCRTERKYSEKMVADLNKTFRKLITLAYREKRLKENPLKMLDVSKTKGRDRTITVTPSEFEAMDRYLADTPFVRNGINCSIKRRLALNYLYYTGMTVGEILALRYEDMIPCSSFQSGTTKFSGLMIKVHGATDTGFMVGLDGAKKSKGRVVPMTSSLQTLFLSAKQEHIAAGGSMCDMVFSFTHSNVADMLKTLTKKLHLNKKIVSQTFRDTFVEKMISGGVTLPQVCTVLGETEGTIVKRYSYLFQNDPQRIIDAFSEERFQK